MDNTNNNIEQLLKEVGVKIEKSKEIARLKGEIFNIFSILGMETKENKTHSNFLAALLNPKGDHGLGDTFLKLFYETLLQTILITDGNNSEKITHWHEIIEGLKDEAVTVKTEEYLGKVDFKNIDGGRVDISVSGNSGKIFIENKIYAGDQHLQIARYVNNPNTVVFYLTLFGEKPSKDSSSDVFEINKHFFLLSYKTDIKKWLEKCQKEASDYPIIRETIKQYLILIKKLTGQLTSNEMAEELYSSILNNLESANVISQNIENAKKTVKLEFLKKLIERLKEKSEIDITINDTSVKGALQISLRKNDWHTDLKYLYEIHPKNENSYISIVLANKPKDAAFFNEVKKILNDDYSNEWACISKTTEICKMGDQFIKDFQVNKNGFEKEIIKNSADKILNYITDFNGRVNEIDAILKE